MRIMTEAEKKELEALKAKAELTADEKKRLEALTAKEKEGAASEKTYSEDYVRSLREENAKYRTKAKAAEEKLAKLDGVDRDEYEALKAKQKELDEKKLMDAGEFNKLREQLVADHQKELDKINTEKSAIAEQKKALEMELNRTILSHEIAVAASVAQAINPRLVEMVAIQNMQVEQLEGGQRIIKVLDSAGNPRNDLKTGEPLRVSQYLEEMKQDESFAHLFAGGKAGANSGTVNFKGSKIVNPWKKESFNLTLQGSILKADPALATRLKAEAGV